MERLQEIWKNAEETNNIQELFESGPLDYKSIPVELFNIFDIAFTSNFIGQDGKLLPLFGVSKSSTYKARLCTYNKEVVQEVWQFCEKSEHDKYFESKIFFALCVSKRFPYY